MLFFIYRNSRFSILLDSSAVTDITDRMRDDAATLALYFREDTAWYQTGGGAAQDDVFSHTALDLLEDFLLDFELLKYTLLE